MALDYMRENPLSSLPETVISGSRKKVPVRKISKKRFYILLAVNLTVWLSAISYYLGFGPASIRESMHEFAKRRGLVVTGVVCNSRMQAAIISDEIYKVGDKVKGYMVIEINKEGVEFKKGEKKIFKKVASL